MIFDDSTIGAVHGEVQATEWGLEQIYQKVMSWQNPFNPIKGYLSPFGLDVAASDPGAGFLFIFLRPFLSTHQSLAMTVVINLFLANIGMYFLLKKLKLSTLASFLIGLSYGYTTALMPRIGGHITYTSIYLFPWFFLCIYNLFSSKRTKVKILSSFGVSLFFVLTLWQNLYFFVILSLSCFLLLLYLFSKRRNILFENIRNNWKYLVLIFISLFLFLYPWLTALYEIFLFEEAPKAVGWLGANTIFASDLLGFFIPGIYNYYYGSFLYPIYNKISFARGIFENFTYPGVIILTCYFSLFIFWKKFSLRVKQAVLPFLTSSFVFTSLTLGPFLKVAGNWFIELDEGIKIVIPLPFIILHYLPFMGNLRVPGRLIMGFVFFASIVTAYIISDLLKNKTNKFKMIFCVLYLAVFVIDQRYNDRDKAQPHVFPTKIYQSIQKDQRDVSVLEIPFSVRDGFTYFGNLNAIFMAPGQLFHKKPVVGGYAGRIPDYVKNYYQENPFFGYLGRLIDHKLSKNPNPGVNSNLERWQILDIKNSLDTVDFLDLKYIIINDQSFNASSVLEIIPKLEFTKIMVDKNYSLWQREPPKKEFISIDIGDNDNLFLGMGWHATEDGFRWVNRRSSVMFKVNTKRKLKLNFQAAAFHKELSLTVYLNRKLLGQLPVSTEMKEYSLPVLGEFETGINTIHFIFDQSFSPAEVLPNNLDARKISAKFIKIYLTSGDGR